VRVVVRVIVCIVCVQGTVRQVYLMGNPVLLVIAFAGVVGFALHFILHAVTRRKAAARMDDGVAGSTDTTMRAGLFLFIAYMFNLLPVRSCGACLFARVCVCVCARAHTLLRNRACGCRVT
jgi:dolichyl-phosphate-mannose--protein O-mannosyl transferase